MKICRKCAESLPLESFSQNLRLKDGHAVVCKPCMREYARARYAADPERFIAEEAGRRRAKGVPERRIGRDPEKVRAYRTKARGARHGLTAEQFLRLAAEGCGACGQTLDPESRNTHIDHDHACCARTHSCGKCVRSAMCQGCNAAMGHVGDSVGRLRLLVAYLDRHAA